MATPVPSVSPGQPGPARTQQDALSQPAGRSAVVGWALVFLLLATTASGVDPQYKTMLDWTSRPPALPSTPRAFHSLALDWRGGSYLLLSTGNGFYLYRVNNPTRPAYVSAINLCCLGGQCAFKPVGDHDHFLTGISVGSRYILCALGIAGVGVVDLGAGSSPLPTVPSWGVLPGTPSSKGGVTFEHDGEQLYLATIPTDGYPGGKRGVYRIGQGGVELLHTAPLIMGQIREGYQVSNRIYVVSAPALNICTYNDTGLTIETTMPAQSIDINGDTMAAATGTVVRLYDISNPTSPVLVREVASGATVACAGAYVAAFRRSDNRVLQWQDSPAAGRLTPILGDWWDPSLPHNTPSPTGPIYTAPALQDCTWSRDGSVLYLARYSIAQLYAFDAVLAIFADGFESGDTTNWSETEGGQ